MKPLPAVILAAGRGVRLRPHTDDTPKALIPIAGRPILWHILNALHTAAGVRDFYVAVGYQPQSFKKFRAPKDCRIHFIENKQWESSNSMLSLSLCMKHLRSGGYIVEGDCCFDATLLNAEKSGRPTSRWFVRPFTKECDGCCLVARKDGLIHKLTIEKRSAKKKTSNRWKSCGVLHVTAALGKKLDRWLLAARKEGREKQYYDLILADHLDAAKLFATDTGTAPWCEVDNEADLKQANALFGSAT
jgi:choline kinase